MVRAECSFLFRSASLALVLLGERSDKDKTLSKVFFSLSQEDDTDRWSSDYFKGDETWYMTPELSDQGSVRGLSSSSLYKRG